MELHVGRGMSSGALTVFPIWNGEGGRRHYTTDAAELIVTEVDTGPSVPGLTAVNRGTKPLTAVRCRTTTPAHWSLTSTAPRSMYDA